MLFFPSALGKALFQHHSGRRCHCPAPREKGGINAKATPKSPDHPGKQPAGKHALGRKQSLCVGAALPASPLPAGQAETLDLGSQGHGLPSRILLGGLFLGGGTSACLFGPHLPAAEAKPWGSGVRRGVSLSPRSLCSGCSTLRR